MATTVVNSKTSRLPGVYIGRPSRWGNPYPMRTEAQRAEVISRYRAWFVKQLEDPKFREATLRLRGKRLVCWCAPRACHGDVIV